MSSSHPIEFIRTNAQNFQQWLFECQHDDLPKSLAVSWIISISNEAKKDDWYSNLIARVSVLGLPVFLGFSVLQLSCVTLGDMATKAMGYSRKEVVVLNPDKPDIAVHTEKEVSLSDDWIRLAKHIVGCVSMIFYCPVGFFVSPTIFIRPSLDPLPQSQQEKALADQAKAHQEVLSRTGTGHTDTLEALREQLQQKDVEKQQALATQAADHEEAMRTVTERSEALELENRTAKQDAFFSTFPTIEADRIPQALAFLRKPELNGITLRVEADTQNKQVSWGTPENTPFEKGKTRFEAIELVDPERFLKPLGSIELMIDCLRFDPRYLAQILSQPHQIHRLVIKSPNMEVLKAADERGVLANIHTLVIRNDDKAISAADLMALSTRFKKIAAFDVRECLIDSDLVELSREHIVYRTEYTMNPLGHSREVSVRESKEVTNVAEQFAALNALLFRIINENYDRETILSIAEQFPIPDQNLLFHCAAPFVTKLSFLRGTDIGAHHIKNLIPRLAPIFPHLTVLDMSYCILLESDALTSLQRFPVESIYLNGCEAILFSRIQVKERYGKGERDPRMTPEYSHHLRRDYLLSPEYVIQRVLHLFNKGVKKIRFDGIKVLKESNSQIKQSLRYIDLIKYHFERTLFPEMEELANPSIDRKTAIFVGEDEHGGFKHDCL